MVWCEAGRSQVGDGAAALRLDGLTAGEQRLLDRMDGFAHGFTETEIQMAARQYGVTAKRAGELLDVLRHGGVLEMSMEPPGAAQCAERDLAHRRDALEAYGRRAKQTVRVIGAGPIATAAAVTLAECAVGGIWPDHEMVRTELRMSHPRVQVVPIPDRLPDLTIAVFSRVADPVVLREVAFTDVPYLPVVVREAEVEVGPVLTPGVGPCHRCLDLHRTEDDPCWPTIATQLRCAEPLVAPPSLLLPVAGTVVSLALKHLAGDASDDTTLVVEPSRPTPRTVPWSVHPECGCTGLDAAVAA
ncbi:molybdopterin/thiamine biosynthesis adenylyltransferase [Bogoriella caseilytica]|uniref:Molybdopterin/thiamine biosynthesis adenylyltransferase n=1 Tax=Bogoriella caseilytica TaxID=56055 RepID=A0A3N2BA27_9MICO|nr:molybdopterin/thiamine biosynthesis adenylyltransferase [Bogoriella caseilytica]